MDGYIFSPRNFFHFDTQAVPALRDSKSVYRESEFTLPVVFRFYPKVYLYAFDHDERLYPVLIRTESMTPTEYWGCNDLQDLSILSKSIYAAHPNLKQVPYFHNYIVNETVSLVNQYSDPQRYAHLAVEVSIEEHVMDRCECDECGAIRESALLAAERSMVPASESSIKNLLKRVSVSPAAAEEDLQTKRRRRIRRITNKVSEGDDCTICSDAFTAGKYVAQMPCAHSFHKPCIQKWLRQSHYCPICRYEMPVAADAQADG